MQVDFRLPREWAAANENVAAVLGSAVDLKTTEIYTFQNIQSALVESVFGLSQLYPHKKKAFFIKNMNPLFDAAIMPLAKMGYIVTGLDASVLADPTAFVAALDREALAVIFSVDDPLLGRRYDTTKLQEALREKPVAQVRVSHNAHFYDGLALLPRTGVHLYSLQSGAIVLVGERSRFGILISDQLANVFKGDINSEFSWAQKPRATAETEIKSFESKRIADSSPVLTTARVFDRALISWNDMDGHAVISRLAERLKLTLGEPGQESRLETTSLSRWGGVRTMDFLRTQGLTPETIRGLVMIAADLLNPEFEKHLIEVRRLLLAEQFAGEKWATPNA
jgi:hypothetical protein